LRSDNGADECDVVVLDSSSSIDGYDDDDVLHPTSSVCRKRKPLCSDNGADECDVVVLDSSSSIDGYDDDDVLHPTSSTR